MCPLSQMLLVLHALLQTTGVLWWNSNADSVPMHPLSCRADYTHMEPCSGPAGSEVMLPEFLGTHKTKWGGRLGPVPLPPTICRTPGGLHGGQGLWWAGAGAAASLCATAVPHLLAWSM